MILKVLFLTCVIYMHLRFMMDLYILYQSVIWRELCDENPRYESRARETMEGACKRQTERMEKVKPKGTRELPTYLAVVTVEVVYVCRYNVRGRRRWSRIGEEPSKMVGDWGREGDSEGDAVTNESDYKLRSPALVLIRFSFRPLTSFSFFFLFSFAPGCLSHSPDRSGRVNARSALLFFRASLPLSRGLLPIYPLSR